MNMEPIEAEYTAKPKKLLIWGIVLLIIVVLIPSFFLVKKFVFNTGDTQGVCGDIKTYWKVSDAENPDLKRFHDCVHGITFDYPKSWGDARLTNQWWNVGESSERTPEFSPNVDGVVVRFSQSDKYFHLNYYSGEFAETHNVAGGRKIGGGMSPEPGTCDLEVVDTGNQLIASGKCATQGGAEVLVYWDILEFGTEGRASAMCNGTGIRYSFANETGSIFAPEITASGEERKGGNYPVCPTSKDDPAISQSVQEGFDSLINLEVVKVLESVVPNNLTKEEQIERMNQVFESASEEFHFGSLKIRTLPTFVNNEFTTRLEVSAFRESETENNDFIDALQRGDVPSNDACMKMGNTSGCVFGGNYGVITWVRVISYDYPRCCGSDAFAVNDRLFGVHDGWVYMIQLPYSSIEKSWYEDEDWTDEIPGTFKADRVPEMTVQNIFDTQIMNALQSIKFGEWNPIESVVQQDIDAYAPYNILPTSVLTAESIGEGISYGYINSLRMNDDRTIFASIDTLSFYPRKSLDPLIERKQIDERRFSNESFARREAKMSSKAIDSLVSAIESAQGQCENSTNGEYLGKLKIWLSGKFYSQQELSLMEISSIDANSENYNYWISYAIPPFSSLPTDESMYGVNKGVYRIEVKDGIIQDVVGQFASCSNAG